VEIIFQTEEIKACNGEKIEEIEVFTCNLEMPLLEIGENFYIEEKNLLVKIDSRCRTSKENVVYYIEPLSIEDEETRNSKLIIEEAITNRKTIANLQHENNDLKRQNEFLEKN
jgi:hypothetical protein